MSIITSKSELKSYILRQLGDGIHNVELSDNQLEDCIENALGYYEREVDGGIEERIYMLELYPDTQTYILDDEVMAVEELITSELSGQNDLTSQLSQVRLDVAQIFTEGGEKIQGYVTTMGYWSMLSQFLGEEMSYSFNTITKKLSIHTPVKETGVIVMNINWSTRNSRGLWNNDFIKEYSTALSMKQWGINMSKYNGAQLVGGMELNGQGMLDMAQTEIDRLREELLDKHTSPLMPMFG